MSVIAGCGLMSATKGVQVMATDRLASPAVLVARAFHEAYERLAPEHGYVTREASAVPWEDVPAGNRGLMIAVAQSLIDEGHICPVLERHGHGR
jgi:hypothetical protein